MADTRRGLFERLLAVYLGARVVPEVLDAPTADAAEPIVDLPPAVPSPAAPSNWPGATYTSGQIMSMSATCSMIPTTYYGATSYPSGVYPYPPPRPDPSIDREPPPEPV